MMPGNCLKWVPFCKGPSVASYRVASGAVVPDRGTKSFKTSMGHTMNFQVTDVTKPPLAVSSVVAMGHRVVVGPKGSRIELSNGQTLPLRKQGNVYVLDIEVVGYESSDAMPVEVADENANRDEQGFSRPAKTL